jgi:hypothetical protein
MRGGWARPELPRKCGAMSDSSTGFVGLKPSLAHTRAIDDIAEWLNVGHTAE